jgi:hypothetical protein
MLHADQRDEPVITFHQRLVFFSQHVVVIPERVPGPNAIVVLHHTEGGLLPLLQHAVIVLDVFIEATDEIAQLILPVLQIATGAQARGGRPARGTGRTSGPSLTFAIIAAPNRCTKAEQEHQECQDNQVPSIP